MKTFRKVIVLVLVLAAVSCSDNSVKIIKTKHTFSIFTTADLQSRIKSYDYDLNGTTQSIGGMDRVSALWQSLKHVPDYALLLSSGDDLMGSFYHLLKGQPEFITMNITGYDVTTPGNHEFDYGLDLYKEALGHAQFDVVCANLTFDDQWMKDKIKPYVIKHFGDIKVGIFGLMTPDLFLLANVGGGVSFSGELLNIAKSTVEELKSQKCDIIIALTHTGIVHDRQIAKEVPDIDIIVGGHDHIFVYETVDHDDGSKTVIVQAGNGCTKLGQLNFVYDSENRVLNDFSWATYWLDSTVGSTMSVAAFVDKFMNDYDDSTNTIVGSSAVDLDCREETVRHKESNMGNLICDSWLEWFSTADLAAVNSGGIRTDELYHAGEISYKDLLSIMPFGNEIYQVEIKGSDLWQFFEVSAAALPGAGTCTQGDVMHSGSFMQIGGARIEIDTSKEAFCAKFNGMDIQQIFNYGNRIVSVEIHNGSSYEPLDTNKTYKILINDYTANGGGGFYMLRKADVKKLNTTVLGIDALIDYFKKNSPVSPKTEARIKFK